MKGHMKDSELTHRDNADVSSGRVVRAVIGALCIVLTIAVLNAIFRSSRTKLPSPSPPDLSHCIRIEVRQPPITRGYPVWRTETEKSLLTPEEVHDIEALLEFAVDAPEDIRAFARMIALGSYDGRQLGPYCTKIIAVLVCHFADRPPLHLVAYAPKTLVTEDKQVFVYETSLSLFDRIGSQVHSSQLLPQIRLRIKCARHLRYLHTGLRGFEDDAAYPSASTWCDALVRRYLRQGGTKKETLRHLYCPAVPKGTCHYAINANCEPDSAEDTVLLFETKAGWDQHGGPELFTFDNHDPKGGCVLLNDGTVKFIRSKEELHALHWK